jgi:hypothetical protein
MFGPLINAWLAHERGEPLEQRRRQAPPPHLQGLTWHFLCECGYRWKAEDTDAELRDGHWCPPVRECVGCHAWIDGRATGKVEG